MVAQARPGTPAGGTAPGAAGPAALTIYYDPGCELCRRCRAWLETEPTWVPLTFVAADAPQAAVLLPDLPWLGTELVVVGDDGSAWIGSAAFVTCLWATVRYRSWSQRLAGPAFAPMAERFFAYVSANRKRLRSAARGASCPDGTCQHRLDGSAPLVSAPPGPVPPLGRGSIWAPGAPTPGPAGGRPVDRAAR